jgi:hypothetical protein
MSSNPTFPISDRIPLQERFRTKDQKRVLSQIRKVGPHPMDRELALTKIMRGLGLNEDKKESRSMAKAWLERLVKEGVMIEERRTVWDAYTRRDAYYTVFRLARQFGWNIVPNPT